VVGFDTVLRAVHVAFQLLIAQVAQRVDAANQSVELEDRALRRVGCGVATLPFAQALESFTVNCIGRSQFCSLEIIRFRCHRRQLNMTKTELQIALAAATQTDKRTAAVFLDTLSNLAYKEIKKNGEFVLPGFGKLVKQKRKARVGLNPKTQQKLKIPAKTVVKFRVAKAAKDAIFGGKK
jgi:DNA-binding protein HU-beta